MNKHQEKLENAKKEVIDMLEDMNTKATADRIVKKLNEVIKNNEDK